MNEATKPDTAALSTPQDPASQASPIAPEPGNVPAALGAGLIAAAVGAVLWAVITVSTHMQIGFMAIGVGFLVAWAVRRFGHGQEQVYGLIGAALSLLGCVAGNLLSACGFVASAQGMSYSEVLARVAGDPSLAMRLMQASFSGMDLLFYGIAVYEGYKLALRPGPR